ncbi:MAG: hypothetical protein F3742_08725 [Nitrospinae bacterium]|nr:hypothetical protein [Nitrospinota bacterium]
MKVDILKNSVEQNNEAVLTDGNQFDKTSLANSVTFTNKERLGLKFTQVGSGNAGDKMVVTIYYQKKAITAG